MHRHGSHELLTSEHLNTTSYRLAVTPGRFPLPVYHSQKIKYRCQKHGIPQTYYRHCIKIHPTCNLWYSSSSNSNNKHVYLPGCPVIKRMKRKVAAAAASRKLYFCLRLSVTKDNSKSCQRHLMNFLERWDMWLTSIKSLNFDSEADHDADQGISKEIFTIAG